ncbi:MAG: hypothetical protein IJI14_13420 [Anaerolineaceae bacterium]|nr:hypothetical protein [Anaerolineaceae bacterium]
MTYDEVLRHFEVKRKNGDSAQCICPAHHDKEASLTISRDKDRTLVHCHAGCRTEDILHSVDLKMQDLFENPSEKPDWKQYVEKREGKKVEDVYHYVDFSGAYTFTRLRLSGKKFLYGFLEDDRFIYGLRGKKRKDFPAVFCESLSAFKEAIRNGQTVYYCEGEKDVRTMISHGFQAITCGASGDWISDCSVLFSEADVVVLADNDPPGRRSATLVCADIEKAAKSVRVIVPMPNLDHGDVSDFFQDHSTEEFQELLKTGGQKEVEDFRDRFHLFTSTGKIKGAFDFEIFSYLKKKIDMLVLGGTVYLYDSGVFSPDVGGAKLKTEIRKLIYPEFIKAPTLKRIYDLFVSDEELQVTSEQLNDFPVEWINFQNGFYNPIEKTFIPHDPKYKAINQIPHNYDPDASCDGLSTFTWLKSAFSDPDDLEMLFQFAGLCLTTDTRQQKFLILHGSGGSGKSTLIKLIEKNGWN